MQLGRLSIIGVGLLGGSIGLAIRASISGCKIIGYGHRRTSLDRALEIGAIDEAEADLKRAVQGADLVILCTPVGIFGEVLSEIAEVLRRGAIVTDVGSTKRSVVDLARKHLNESVSFVGSHPIAGSEKRGIEFSRADLFQNALCILTPDGETDPKAVVLVEQFWRMLGMRTCRMTPTDHDAALAEVSHLPHALAAALVALQSDDGMKLAGKGFLDATRIAGGDGRLWRDIFVDNADNVRSSLAKLRQMLDHFETLLAPGRGEELRAWLDSAAGRRAALLAEKLREVNPD
jgi:prephenate dehydrogenase